MKNKESSSESDNEENSREDDEDSDIFRLVAENDENDINEESLDLGIRMAHEQIQEIEAEINDKSIFANLIK